MTEPPYPQWEQAIQHRDAAEFEAAAHSFTRAAHERFAAAEYVSPPFERSAQTVAFALYSVLSAAVYYRISGNEDQCENRCQNGVLHCEELRDNVVSYDAQRGVFWEYIGDFRTIADSGHPDDAYASARGYYEDVTNPIRWQTEPEFEMNMTFMLELADFADWDISRREKRLITVESLLDRIAFKSKTFPEIIKAVTVRGD